MQNNIIINKDFQSSILRLRKILPVIAFGLLIGTYLISALIMGIFHAQNANGLGFIIAAFLVPLAIQLGRGTLVFFFQLNPAHIQGKYSFGIIAATVLLFLSLIEAYLVLIDYGLSWMVSVATLLSIGWIIEIMILKETIFATQIELYQDQDKWNELKSLYIARAELEKFMEELNSGKIPVQPAIEGKAEWDVEQNKALSLLAEINEQLEGNVLSPLKNGQINH